MLGALIGGIAAIMTVLGTAAKTVVSTAQEIFSAMPTILQLASVTAILYVDANGDGLIGEFFNFFTFFLGLTINSFILFVLVFVFTLIYAMASVNNWFGGG